MIEMQDTNQIEESLFGPPAKDTTIQFCTKILQKYAANTSPILFAISFT